MSKPDAERALKIYKAFVKQTDHVVRYLSIARHYEHSTRLEIPKIKHAPTSLSSSLEEYLKDPDFEINRRQYLAQQEAKKGSKPGASKSVLTKSTEANGAKATSSTTDSKPASKGPAPDLIDFFESIEQNQQPMVQATYQQPQFAPQMTSPGFQTNPFLPQTTGMPAQNQQQQLMAQNTNPFLQQGPQQPQVPLQQQQQIPQNFTGAPFQGFAVQNQQQARFAPTLQSVPQSTAASFQSPTQQPFPTGITNGSSIQSTNPFRQSMLASSTTGTSISSFSSATSSPFTSQPTSTNPFAKPTSSSLPSGQSFGPSPFNSQAPASSVFPPTSPGAVQQPPSIIPQPTGSTNPFAKPPAVSQAPNPFGAAPVSVTPTGSTNPFRQSAFVNQNTGVGWQNSAQGTIGGISGNQVDTVPVFPRPGMG
jgi:phosphatidylinositol-binding clathrin assembly protein